MAEVSKSGTHKRTKTNVIYEDLSQNEKTKNVLDGEVKDVKYGNNKPPVLPTTEPSADEREFAPEGKTPPKSTPYNPLTESPVEEKSYATNEPIITETTTESIPEQTFEAPPQVEPDAEEPTIQDTPFEETTNDEPEERYKGNTQDMPKAEQKKEAKLLAEVILRGYQQYRPKIYKQFGKISDKKVKKLEAEGKVNFGVIIQHRNGTRLTIGEEVQRRNSRLDHVFDVSDEWVEDLRPHVEFELAKMNWGMSSLGYICLRVAEDNINCIQQLTKFTRENADFLEFAKDMTYQVSLNVRRTRAAPEPPPQTETPPPPTSPPPADDGIETVQAVEIKGNDEGDVN